MKIDERDLKFISYWDKFLSAFISFWIYFAFKSDSLQPTLFCSEEFFVSTWNFVIIINFLFIIPTIILIVYLSFFKYKESRDEFGQEISKILWRKKGCLKYFIFGITTVGIFELINRFVCGSF